MDPTPVPTLSAVAARRAARLAAPHLARELKTLTVMLRLYCRDHHATAVHNEERLCLACNGLLDYARKRLVNCPFGADKPTCANCRVHCYGREQREAIRIVMRHAGPRMLFSHPLLALAHVFAGRRPAPPGPSHAGATPPDEPAGR